MNYLISFHKFTEQLINIISVSQIICDQIQNKKKTIIKTARVR